MMGTGMWMQMRKAPCARVSLSTSVGAVDLGVCLAATTCQRDLEQVLICNWHSATLLSLQSPGTGLALPHNLSGTMGAGLLLAHGLPTLTEMGHREEQSEAVRPRRAVPATCLLRAQPLPRSSLSRLGN